MSAPFCPSLECGRTTSPRFGHLILGPLEGRRRTAGSQPSPEGAKYVPLCGKEGLSGNQGKGTPATPLLGTDVGSCVSHFIK